MHISQEVEMRTANRCPDCRDGLVCAESWEFWYSRCDDTGGVLDEERPDCDEEVECPRCGGTGLGAARSDYPRSHAA